MENARIYTRPDQAIELMVAAGGSEAAALAGRIGDGLVSTSPDPDVVEAFATAGGEGKPRYGQVTVCWAEREAEARKVALEQWPNAALRGPLGQELALPSYFEDASAMVTEDAIAEAIVCGPDAELHARRIDEYLDAGFTHVCLHQVGKDQQGFMAFFEKELAPRYARVGARAV